MEFTNRDETVLSLGNEMQTAAVLGQRDENLLRIEKEVNAEILVRGDEVRIKGNETQREKALRIFNHLKTLAAADVEINANVLNYAVAAAEEKRDDVAASLTGNIYVTPKGKQIKARTLGQKRYVEALSNHDIVFAPPGPARPTLPWPRRWWL